MKKLTFSYSLGCVLLVGALSAHAEDIQHGLNIYGKLQAAPSSCTVLMSKYVINLHHDERSLPLQDKQAYGSDDKVYIQLGGDSCDANEGYKNIGLKFIGTVDNAMGNVLANTASESSAAQGVGIRLTDMFNNILIPNSTIAFFPSASQLDGKPTDLTASFPLNLTLVQLKNQEATPGEVQTNMTVQIERL
ncbi:TPA: type 1 fimbrial protein [Citrobacter amalonaticus]|nr:type 1 fimbrial protein [Citrobacter amalonaticus]